MRAGSKGQGLFEESCRQRAGRWRVSWERAQQALAELLPTSSHSPTRPGRQQEPFQSRLLGLLRGNERPGIAFLSPFSLARPCQVLGAAWSTLGWRPQTAGPALQMGRNWPQMAFLEKWLGIKEVPWPSWGWGREQGGQEAERSI